MTTITGTNANDFLNGTDGNDTIDGLQGADQMSGGKGNDTYVVDNAGDWILELQSGGGIDTVKSSVSYTLAGTWVENLQLTGNTGSNATGNDLNNTLTGNDLDNVLDGKAGVDTLVGGKGDDTYYVNNAGDKVVESANQGTADAIVSTVDYALAGAANVENLHLLGSALNGTGNALANRIDGNDLGNTLDGGAGADTLNGGKGGDVYHVDNTLDKVYENQNEGLDTVVATASTVLSANVEQLFLAGSSAINGSGNELDNVILGNTGNNVIDGGLGVDDMRGDKGNDTYIVDNVNDQIAEGVNGGTDTVKSAVSYSLSHDVENLVLTGTAMTAIGNELNNQLTGNDGNNVLLGGLGKDTMTGGNGDDTYQVNNIGDKVIEAVGGGHDTVVGATDCSIAAFANVEDLTLTGGTYATGNALDNVIHGSAGSSIIDGGKGADTMIGGAQWDVYYVDNAGDQVVEADNGGNDTVYSTVALAKAFDNVEIYHFEKAGALNFAGSQPDYVIVYAGAGNDTITGGNGGDQLNGGAGNDFLKGDDGNDIIIGGTGADQMTGGAGNDGYYIDNANDTVTELAGGGIDHIHSTVSIADLAKNVEELELAGTGALNATGNELDNFIGGTSGNNIIDGGIGADTMYGYGGNDAYIVDNAQDKVNEAYGEGTDLVKSSISYTLGHDVENFTLAGTGNISATGNGLNNVLTGNDGSNSLDGGAGKDTMTGGKGDDIYVVDDAGDKVVESVTNANGGGHDAVYASVDFSLAALANVEDLYLTSSAHATGNASGNHIYGTGGADWIDGGAGADAMTGYGGNDTYQVDNLFDSVQEGSGGGTYDTVISTVALTTAYSEVENYIFKTNADVHFTGAAADNEIDGGGGKDVISGGAGDDNLLGGAGDDKLDGGIGNNSIDGGTGADDLAGGTGNDTYTIDNAKDVVHESAGEGVNWATTYVTLPNLFENVENVEMEGTANINVTGNKLDNVLIGNSANNTIAGGDGKDDIYGFLGNDTLSGDAGADTFHFDRTPSTKNEGHDVIKDFAKGEDFLSFEEVIDQNKDGHVDLDDLLAGISSIVDHGAGKDVEVKFADGGIITFTGLGSVAGTSAADHLTTLVDVSHIQVHA